MGPAIAVGHHAEVLKTLNSFGQHNLSLKFGVTLNCLNFAVHSFLCAPVLPGREPSAKVFLGLLFTRGIIRPPFDQSFALLGHNSVLVLNRVRQEGFRSNHGTKRAVFGILLFSEIERTTNSVMRL